MFIHEGYNDTTNDNDIAVLVLDQSLGFNDHVKPIQLRDPRSEPSGASFFETVPPYTFRMNIMQLITIIN